jgi:hypothetical protein
MINFFYSINNGALIKSAYCPLVLSSLVSKQANFFSTEKKKKINNEINSQFITGLTDAEGTFIVSISNNPKLKNSWMIQCYF